MYKEFRLYWRLVKVHILSGLEYKGWWLTYLNVLFYCFAAPLSIILIFGRFGNIGGWTMERILFIYAITSLSFSIAKCLCNGFDYFPWYMVRGGAFDRLLLRPKTLFTQVAGSYFNIQRLANPVAAVIIMTWAISRLEISFSALDALMLIFALAGGFMVYAGVFVMSSGISFFTISGLDWIYVFSNASMDTTRIPVDHMPGALRSTLTFFMPLLVISYFPASAIGGWGGAYWRGWLALPAGAAFLGAAVLIWQLGIRHYKSTGS